MRNSPVLYTTKAWRGNKQKHAYTCKVKQHKQYQESAYSPEEASCYGSSIMSGIAVNAAKEWHMLIVLLCMGTTGRSDKPQCAAAPRVGDKWIQQLAACVTRCYQTLLALSTFKDAHSGVHMTSSTASAAVAASQTQHVVWVAGRPAA